jgi:hypothetical protein
MIFATGSLAEARRATDALRGRRIEAVLRADWRRDDGGSVATTIRYRVVVDPAARRDAVRLLRDLQLDGDLAADRNGERLATTAIVLLLLAATTACGVWLAVRAAG